MNSKFNLIFICFVINLINVHHVSTMMEEQDIPPMSIISQFHSLVFYNDSETEQMSQRDRLHLHHAFVRDSDKWRNGQIEYEIDKNFDDKEKRRIFAAMKRIERHSCIRFVEHDASHNCSDYVMIVKDYAKRSESSSYLGCRHEGKQFIWLGIDMLYDTDHQATILHELLHTLGFNHHHQRSDRDKYVEIHLENTNLSDIDILNNYIMEIRPDKHVKFLTPFDFESVMLYNRFLNSKNFKPVITSKINGTDFPMFRPKGMSRNDKLLLNKFYDCPQNGSKSRVKRIVK